MKAGSLRAHIHPQQKQFTEEKADWKTTMDAMNLLGLACAVLAALAFGVLLAYSCCQAIFVLLRMHSRALRPAVSVAPVEAQAQAS